MIDRREKKCFLGATLVHAALVVVLLVGPAFLSSKPPALPLLDYIPGKTVDAALNRGGTPRVAPPAAAPPAARPAQSEPAPPPEPPQPKPPVKAPEPEPEPVPEPPKSAPKADSFKVTEKKSPPKKTVTKTEPATSTKSLPKVSTKLVTKNADQAAKQREADRKAADKAAKDFQDTIKQTTKSLTRSLSDSVTVEVDGVPGPGGPSVANWAQVVHSIYDRAWIEPTDATDGRATAKATITIAKDGSVVSASLTSPSGNATLDKSVRAVLDRVREVPAFPAGAREERRTVTIKFNLLAQRLPG